MILEKKIPLRYLLQKAKGDLIFVSIFSISIATFTEFLTISYNFPFSIPAFLGTAISLVLSFKLSQSYDRWWEARKIWGAIVNDSRTLVIQLKSFCNKPDHVAIKVISYRQICWCHVLTKRLRDLPLFGDMKSFLSQDDISKLEFSKNIPMAIIDLNSLDINKLYQNDFVSPFQQIQLDKTLVRLCESLGQAERIKNTVFPKQYRMFLHFFIYIFIITLGFALSGLKFYFEIPLLISITLPFLLLEKTALLLQDPFENRPDDIPMTNISKTIEANIKELLDEDAITQEETTDEFYMM